ncbi:recombination directionality factor [Streptomyces drozdowiczii]|uniref:recombination directionality factor n=1 Tax=Streptomyces drozdowiczii TaxID=202862 RepID=UPI00403C630C
MPILDLQRRMRQLGEIRIGHVVKTGRTSQKTGKEITRPAKLNNFRFTSPSREILAEVANLYGGEVVPWTPANGGPSEFEVYSTTNRLPVLIPPRDAVSQWYELYAGSKCQRRCDGVTEHKRDRPCLCDPENRECKITTRVNVMLRDVPALGQWLLITKGYYAATELPPAAELLSQAGGYVAGWLGMEEKLVQRDEGPARFMVPTLDVEITPAALMAGQVTGAPAVASGPERPAIEAGTAGVPAGPPKDFLLEAKQAATQGEVLAIFQAAKDAGAPVSYQEQIKAIGLNKPETAAGPHPDDTQRILNPADYGDASPEQVSELVHDAEIVEDDDVEDLWFRIIAAAGAHGMTTDEVESEFARANGGQLPATANATALRTFLATLKGGRS